MSQKTHNSKTGLQRYTPLIIFMLLVALLGIGLTLNPRLVPSPLVGKPVPEFELPVLGEESTFSHHDLKGHITLLNVWASWCYACRVEHETVTQLSRRGFRIIGLNYKDKPEDAKAWLKQFGNPYQVVVEDATGRISIDWGVYGAPETFLIDRDGIIRHKVIGPLSDEKKYESLMRVINEISGAEK
jgi:cytochrome c biogenesis protein CcmG/thiol:disulfide interchange protein DsbE